MSIVLSDPIERPDIVAIGTIEIRVNINGSYEFVVAGYDAVGNILEVRNMTMSISDTTQEVAELVTQLFTATDIMVDDRALYEG